MTSDLRFLEDGLAIADDLEAAAARWDQLHVRLGKACLDLSRQTGGSWMVASDSAVFDADFHGRDESTICGLRREFSGNGGVALICYLSRYVSKGTPARRVHARRDRHHSLHH